MSVLPGQERIPLLEALQDYHAAQPAYFCIPGHRFAQGTDPKALAAFGEGTFGLDLTETDGLDDLHAPQGVIAEAQQLAAQAWRAEQTFFLVNGSTSGNEAMFLATLRPGEKVLLSRDAHTSILSALILTGADPVWIYPPLFSSWSLPAPITVAQVETALSADPSIRAVFLTRPSYYGIAGPLKEIAACCHRYGIPLLVDEAHGAHFSFSDRFPQDALSAGADLVVQSLHKTGTSLTQSSLLHMQGDLVSADAVREGIRLVTSSSPSYLLMASLDAARHQLATRGEELLEEAYVLALDCRRKLQAIEGVDVLSREDGFLLDPLRITFSLRPCGVTGTAVKEILFREHAVSVELADAEKVVLVLTWGNTEEEIDRLLRGVAAIADSFKTKFEQFDSSDTEQGYSRVRVQVRPATIALQESAYREAVCTPREAFYTEKDTVPITEAAGEICGEQVTPYPPGVPLLYPGERIGKEEAVCLRELAQSGCTLHGLRDPNKKTIQVLKYSGSV